MEVESILSYSKHTVRYHSLKSLPLINQKPKTEHYFEKERALTVEF